MRIVKNMLLRGQPNILFTLNICSLKPPFVCFFTLKSTNHFVLCSAFTFSHYYYHIFLFIWLRIPKEFCVKPVIHIYLTYFTVSFCVSSNFSSILLWFFCNGWISINISTIISQKIQKDLKYTYI